MQIPGANAELEAVVLTAPEVTTAGIPVEGAVYPGGLAANKANKTLDECGRTYPSDTKRAARIQTSYVAASNTRQQTASNEVVKYTNGGAAQAYQEIRHSLATCPARFSEGKKTFGSHTTVVARDPKLTDQQVTATQLVTVGKQRIWTAITFLYEGDLFSGVYTFRSTAAQALAANRLLAAIATTKLNAAFANEGTLV